MHFTLQQENKNKQKYKTLQTTDKYTLTLYVSSLTPEGKQQ